jgi:hypothetical protein
MPEFRFYVEPDVDSSGSDVGDIEVIGRSGAVSSRGHEPSQSMLIYVSLINLVDGLEWIVRNGRGSYKFDGICVAGKFSLKFSAKRNGPVVIKAGKLVIDESDVMDFSSSFWLSVKGFTDRHLVHVAPNSEVRFVLERSLAAYEAALQKRMGSF